MARSRLHTLDDLLDVAERIVTSGDPTGLTLRSLATATGASNGTIYHAFSSKDDLLARLWLRAGTRLGDLMGQASHPDEASGADAVVRVALASVELVSRHPDSARLFFAQRRDQLFSDDVPPETETALTQLQARLIALLVDLAHGVWARTDAVAVDAVAVCVVDLPGGVVRRLLLEDRAADATTADRVEAAVRAVLAVPLPPRSLDTRSTP